MKNALFTFAMLVFCTALVAQNPSIPSATKTQELLANPTKKTQLSNQSTVLGIPFRNIGPSIMSGRVVDINVNPDNSGDFFVAYASGGLWRTKNMGTSFTPLFDHEQVITIGAFDVNWESGEIWLGTGEVNSSRSSYAGMGVFYSNDWGNTWEHKGLENTQHIGRVLIDPENPSKIWVASLGHLYSPGGGGLFTTTNGGTSWENTLNIEGSGIVDLVYSEEMKLLFASSWERTRTAWNFTEGGASSGIHLSKDGGKTWSLISTKIPGFEQGKNTGRIGLALNDSEDQFVLYACVDNQNPSRKESEEKGTREVLKAEDFEIMSLDEFKTIETEKWETFFEESGLEQDYNSTEIKHRIEKGELQVSDLHSYFHDANDDLFDAPIKGLEIYRLDGGNTSWNQVFEGELADVVYTYGYYFGTIAVSPRNPENIYVAGVPIIQSMDGGKTWEGRNAPNMHVDHHKIWINPENDKHLIIGNDGGINITFDGGKNYIKCNSPAVGQFYSVAIDQAEPYNVYGGLQDNGVWKGSSQHIESSEWHQTGEYGFKFILGGDGMRVQIDSRDNTTVYTGYQFGHYYRMAPGKEDLYIHPKHELGEEHLRWNWQTPFLISRHQEDVLYMGSNQFHRSLNKGEDWKSMSGDLTNGAKTGDVPFGSLTVIDESPLNFGWIAVGSDDGMIHVSKDGGQTWSKRSGGYPANMWITKLEWSAHEENLIYMTCNGYRFDHFEAYVYKSRDAGKTWTRIGKNLPKEAVNVVLEDKLNPELVFVGTDNGVYCSLDGGLNFMAMSADLPSVPVHDMVISEKAEELVIATHGRSFYIAPIHLLREASEGVWMKTPSGISDSQFEEPWNQWFTSEGPFIDCEAKLEESGEYAWKLFSEDNNVLLEGEVLLHKGYNLFKIDMSNLKGKLETEKLVLEISLKDLVLRQEIVVSE